MTFFERANLAGVRERGVEAGMHSFLRRDIDAFRGEQIVDGNTKKQRKRREQIMRTFLTNEKFEGVVNESYDPLTTYLETIPVQNKHASTRPDRYEDEAELSLDELAVVVAREVQDYGFKISTNWDDRAQAARERRLLNPHNSLMGIMATSKTGYLPGDRILNRPALLKPQRERKKHKNKFVRMKKVSSQLPIGIESRHYPLDNDMYDPYNVRKCVLYCKLHSLQLPKIVRTRLLQIAGHLYDPGKDLFILKSQKKRTFSANKNYIFSIMTALLREAWKADLNYIPSKPDKLEPHQIVEQELNNVAKEEEKKKNSFDSISEINDFTLFQITSPFTNSDIEKKKQKVQIMIDKLSTPNKIREKVVTNE